MKNRFVLLSAIGASLLSSALGYKNVHGEELKSCSSQGMALTGFTRTGYCVDQDDDSGSHHICIDLSSATGGNFCQVTEQPNWCADQMLCHDGSRSFSDGSEEKCTVQNWCVCQWAFAGYLEKAGGCDKIQNIVCDAINIEAVNAYRGETSQIYKDALECIEKRCGTA